MQSCYSFKSLKKVLLNSKPKAELFASHIQLTKIYFFSNMQEGDVYVGTMVNGLPEGKGEFVYGEGGKKWEKYIGMRRAPLKIGHAQHFSMFQELKNVIGPLLFTVLQYNIKN